MGETSNKRYIGLIGVGFLFLWGCAIIPWINLSNAGNTFGQVLGFIGSALVSVSGLALVFYTSSLESKIKDLKKQNAAHESEMLFWKSQAQLKGDLQDQRKTN